MKIIKLMRNLGLILLILSFFTGMVIAGKGYHMYRSALSHMSLEQKVESIRTNPDYTAYDKLPKTYTSAVVSVEDHRFYSHPGIDIIALGRAFWNDLKAGAYIEGGSTITQQLAKNMYFTQEKELTRKAAEAFMAFHIEHNYSKQEILELYLNSIYFGDGYYCIRDASKGYFNVEPEDMTDYQSTLLAGVPNAPSAYAPSENPDLAELRRQKVIGRMVVCGYFSPEEAAGIVVQ